jgi:hypothetical protein
LLECPWKVEEEEVGIRVLRVALLLGLAFTALAQPGEGGRGTAEATGNVDPTEEEPEILSPIWQPSIRRWSEEIAVASRTYRIDPDLIAAVINSESNGISDAVSRMGAVGLMGVMPSGPGLEWRPTSEELMDPAENLDWGGAILADVIRQSGGDIYAALAAYAGGWRYANSRVPQEYAARVLNDYGRAVAARSGVSPDIALQWTVAVEIRKGHIPAEPLLMGRKPLSGLRTYGEHLVYDYADDEGRAYFIKGYAVPLALVVPLENDAVILEADSLETPLLVRLGYISDKADHGSSRLLLACLPSLNRLRGYMSTRWFAPTSCPSWHR